MAPKSNQIRVLHVITGLQVGGAEMMLYNLVSEQSKNGLNIGVVSLGEGGEIKDKLVGLGVPVADLSLSRVFPSPLKLWQLVRIIKQARPDVVQTWMYHANLLGGLAGKLADVPVVWGIHHTSLDPKTNKRLTLLIAKLGAFLSWLPRQIIYCSKTAEQVHVDFGYDEDKSQVITNGFDLSAFYPSQSAREKIRQELGIGNEVSVIGLVGRWHPLKDHANFVTAAKLLTEKRPNVHFILCGAGITWENLELAAMIKSVGLQNNFHLLGSRTDMRAVMNALDICALTSKAEAFPLVLGEAMACGVPCAVTDVGDCAEIIGEFGRVAPLGNPEAMTWAWEKLLGTDREDLGQRARQWIQEKYSISSVEKKYQEVYRCLLSKNTLALFFTRGVSLQTWDKVGNLAREIRLYNELAKSFSKIYFFTYGNRDDWRFQNKLAENIEIVPKRWKVPDLLYMFLLPLACRKELRQTRVLKTNQMKGGLAALLAKWLYRKPLVVRCGFEWLMFSRQLNSLRIKQWVVYWVERVMYKHADRIILSAQNSINFVKKEFEVPDEKIVLIRNYIDTDLFKPLGLTRELGSICFVGRLSEQKNLFNLISALIGLDVKLVLFGSGPLKDALHTHANEQEVTVEFRGNIENQQLSVELNKCSIFILPSWYEGNPKVLLEAMACGLPVIASDVVGNQELIDHEQNGLLCGTDPASIREKVVELLQNRASRDILCVRARQTIESTAALPVTLKQEMEIYEKYL